MALRFQRITLEDSAEHHEAAEDVVEEEPQDTRSNVTLNLVDE